MPKSRQSPEFLEVFNHRFRPNHVPLSGTRSAPSLFSGRPTKDRQQATWVVSPRRRIEELSSRRAALLRRLGEGDATAQPEYDRTLAALREAQKAEVARLEAQYAVEDEREAETARLHEDNERFLAAHAHLVPTT